jgi:quercetin dioxygenase-like cupin family protein
MQYRTHEDGPLTTIRIEPGAVVVEMLFDLPGCHTRLHAHTFDHTMHCVSGRARIEIDGDVSIVGPGDSYLVEAHKQHAVWPLALDTVLRCVHEHADIHPNKAGDGIPAEWLQRLTTPPASPSAPETIHLDWNLDVAQ